LSRTDEDTLVWESGFTWYFSCRVLLTWSSLSLPEIPPLTPSVVGGLGNPVERNLQQVVVVVREILDLLN